MTLELEYFGLYGDLIMWFEPAVDVSEMPSVSSYNVKPSPSF